MASNLTSQVRNIADVTKAVAGGRPVEEDHGRREGRDPGAEEHINTMVDQLRSFAAEVTRVAREVAPKASSAGRPTCRASAGTWKDLTSR
jgi:hypothetical protein